MADLERSLRGLASRTEEVLELAAGIVLVATYQSGRPLGGSGEVEIRQGWVVEFADGKVRSVSLFATIDEARVAAQRLAS